MLDLIGAKKRAQPTKTDASLDVTDATFMAEVVEASRTTPVVVDFWAPWCGPCRQLTPVIEKVVAATKGAVRLVKVNIDENPRIAAQLRVQSIPTVYAFVDGQPVDGFQGALPESQIRAFIDGLAGPPADADLTAYLDLADRALEAGDVRTAAQTFSQILQAEPANLKALAGLARCYLLSGDAARAEAVLAKAPQDAKDADLDAARTAVALAKQAPSDQKAIQRWRSADPGDHDARFNLAKALAGQGDYAGAIDNLLTIIAADRTWRDGEARKTLLMVFEAAGPSSEATRSGRRRLSALLFA